MWMQKGAAQQASLKKRLAMKNQQLRRQNVKIMKLQEQVAEQKHGSDGLDVVRHTGGRKLTWKGSIVLGLRKSMALVSASSFPLAALVETSRWTVVRAEVQTWAHIVSRCRTFNQASAYLLHRLRTWMDFCKEAEVNAQNDADAATAAQQQIALREKELEDASAVKSQDSAIMSELHLPILPAPGQGDAGSCLRKLRGMPKCSNQRGGPSTFALGATYFCGDATNSSIWHRQKLQGLEVSNSLLVNWVDACAGNLKGAFRTVPCMLLASIYALDFNLSSCHLSRKDLSCLFCEV